MFNITFEEIVEWACLVMFELVTSFSAVSLLFLGIYLLVSSCIFWGIIAILIAIILIFLFIGGIVCYVKGDKK